MGQPGGSGPSSPGLPDPRSRGAHHAQAPGADQDPYQAPPASSFRGPAQDMPVRQPMTGSPGQGPPGNQGIPEPPRQYQQRPYGMPAEPMPGQYPSAPAGQDGGSGAASYVPPQAPYGGPPPASAAPVPPGQALPIADAVQAAHAEGFEFGQSVAREAPALWLEAVLARKPRMPSDLEARLLQDSALPIDSLLHDETRHALRRGFWDALERSRR